MLSVHEGHYGKNTDEIYGKETHFWCSTGIIRLGHMVPFPFHAAVVSNNHPRFFSTVGTYKSKANTVYEYGSKACHAFVAQSYGVIMTTPFCGYYTVQQAGRPGDSPKRPPRTVSPRLIINRPGSTFAFGLMGSRDRACSLQGEPGLGY